MSLPPAEKVVLVTGASSGFGKACSELLSKKGHKVYGTSRKLDKETKVHEMIQMNINDDNSIKSGISNILEKEGRLDVVVNNAGSGIAGSIEDTSIEEIKFLFETNFFGVLRVFHEVLPIMRAQKSGYIINISSIGGLISVPFQGAYCSSKFALEGLTEALRMEIKSFGIHAVLIEPGDFDTGFIGNRIDTAQSQINSKYSVSFKKAMNVQTKGSEKNASKTSEVAVLVDKIIHNPSPNLRYTVGPKIQRFAVHLKKLIPSRLFERIIMKNYNI